MLSALACRGGSVASRCRVRISQQLVDLRSRIAYNVPDSHEVVLHHCPHRNTLLKQVLCTLHSSTGGAAETPFRNHYLLCKADTLPPLCRDRAGGQALERKVGEDQVEREVRGAGGTALPLPQVLRNAGVAECMAACRNEGVSQQ